MVASRKESKWMGLREREPFQVTPPVTYLILQGHKSLGHRTHQWMNPLLWCEKAFLYSNSTIISSSKHVRLLRGIIWI